MSAPNDVTELPTLDEVLGSAVPFLVRLKVPFRGVTERKGLLLHGPAGWGEFAPFADYDDVGAAAWLAAAVEAAWLGFPDSVRTQVPVNGIVPALEPKQAGEMAAAAARTGVQTIKVKVGGRESTRVADLMRVQSVRDAVGPDVAIRLDANASWTPDFALAVLEALGDVGLEYIEQPCSTLEECAIVKSAGTVRVAVDEGLRRAADVTDAALHDRIRDAADVVIVKPIPLGGVRRAQRVVEAIGLPTVVSGAMDTSVGLLSGIALAAALPGEPLAAGLGTGALLATDVTSTTTIPVGGVIEVRRIEPAEGALRAAATLTSKADLAAFTTRLTKAWNAGAMRLLEDVIA